MRRSLVGACLALALWLAGNAQLLTTLPRKAGAEYYVRNGGNDADTGGSDTQAWAHHPWMEDATGVAAAHATTLRGGDTVYMKRGSSWVYAAGLTNAAMKVQSQGTSDYITTTAYGTGDKPLIHVNYDTAIPAILANTATTVAYLQFENLEIKHFQGAAAGTGVGIQIGLGTSGTTWPHHIRIQGCKIWNVGNIGLAVYNGHHIYIGNGNRGATASATDFDNEISTFGYIGIMTAGASQQATDEVYLYGNYIHDASQDGTETFNEYGIAVSGNATTTGYPKNVYARYNFIRNIPAWEAFDTHGVNNLYVEYNRLENVSCGFSLATGEDTTYRDASPGPIFCRYNSAYNEPDFIITHGPAVFYRAEGTTGARPDITIAHNSGGYSATRTTATVMTFVRLINYLGTTIVDSNVCENGLAVMTPIVISTAAEFGPITISRNSLTAVTGISVANTDKLKGTLNIDYNFIRASDVGINFAGGTTIDVDVAIRNNTVVCTGNTPVQNVGKESINGHTVEIKNNILKYTTLRLLYIDWNYTPGAGVSTPTFANNLYHGNDPAYANHNRNGTTMYPLADWLAIEATALEADPLFVSATDFSLQALSPAVDSGVDVGLTTDILGNPIVGTPDRGAYERQP